MEDSHAQLLSSVDVVVRQWRLRSASSEPLAHSGMRPQRCDVPARAHESCSTAMLFSTSRHTAAATASAACTHSATCGACATGTWYMLNRNAAGASMASAAVKPPNKNGPPAPCRARQSDSSASRRFRSLSAAAGHVARGASRAASKGKCCRTPNMPLCISAATARACARAGAAAGQACVAGNVSAGVATPASQRRAVSSDKPFFLCKQL